MSRKRLGAIDSETVKGLRALVEGDADTRRSKSIAKGPPIAQVAASTGRDIEDEMLKLRRENTQMRDENSAFVAAEKEGLLLKRIPLDQIDLQAISRDRRGLARDSEAWTELKNSLKARGQQTPIEVMPATGGYPYALISGYRRLNALIDLKAETGEARFDEVIAIIRTEQPAVDAMISMIEENEIREGVSFYERGRICCLAADRGVVESVDEAIDVLFANSSRNRRYKIRNFTLIYQKLGALLDFPEEIGERLGAKLAQALKQGQEARLVEALSNREARHDGPEDEVKLLEQLVSAKPERTPKPAPEPSDRKAVWRGAGVRMAAIRKGAKAQIMVEGLDLSEEHALQDLLDVMGETILSRARDAD